MKRLQKLSQFILAFIFLFSCSSDPEEPVKYSLTTSASPTEGGSVSITNGSYEQGAVVTLEATPASGYSFIQWTGSVQSSENPVSVTMNGAKQVTAIFERSIDGEDQGEELFIYELLTGENTKTWRIKTAQLTNSNGTFDISESYGILDDEFIFKSQNPDDNGNLSGTIIWNKRKGIAYDTGKTDDSYALSEEMDFTINNGIEITSSDFELEIGQDQELIGRIFGSDQENESISIVLTEKLSEDYKAIPNSLNFKLLEEFSSVRSYTKSTGFASSYQNNSLYLSNRDDSNNRVRKVFKYELTDRSLDSTTITYPENEFVSSRLHFIEDRLVVLGSAFVSEFDLGLEEPPNVQSNGVGENLSRAGTAAVDSQIYVLGGDLERFGEPQPHLRIRRYNHPTSVLQTFLTIPEPRSLAEGEIVDNSLYIIGGYYTVSNEPETVVEQYSDILVIDLTDETYEKKSLPMKLYYTSAARYQNLIFIGGIKPIVNVETDVNLVFGAFDTHTDSFRQIPVSFENRELLDVRIEALTVLGDTLYVALVDKSGATVEVHSIGLENF